MKSINAVLIVVVFLSLQSSISAASDSCLIDTFSTLCSDRQVLPCGWYATRNDVTMISLVQESGNHFVKIKTMGGCTAIGKKCSYNSQDYPLLSWKWRMHVLPLNAREDLKKYADSGAGVYVIFHAKMGLNRIIKYVWSSTLSVGTAIESPFNPRVKVVVLRNSNDKMDSWIEEEVNVLEDYRRFFNSMPPMVDVVAIMSDSDNTQSMVEADYDDFWIRKKR
jgi:hypothetical protein